MRYTVLQDNEPIEGLAFLPDLESAKRQGEEFAAANAGREVSIEGYPGKNEALITLAPLTTWRFDRELNTWVEI